MTPDQMRDASLLELFRLEAEAQTQVLNAGLMALERSPTQADQLEACMRAAHSLKGAARIVGLDAGVRVAHVMEDCLVEAQDGRLLLQSEHIDALLQGCDLLLRIGTRPPATQAGPKAPGGKRSTAWCSASKAWCAAACRWPARSCRRRLPACRKRPRGAASGVSGRQRRQRRRARRAGGRRTGRGAPQPGPAGHRRAPGPAAGYLQQVAGGVPAHQAAGRFLQRLRRLQSSASRALDVVRETVQETALDPQAQAMLGEARQLIGECQQMLVQHIADLDEFAWQGGQRAQVLYDAALASRMRPFADVLSGQARMVRDLGRSLGKQVRLLVEGESTQVDRDVLENSKRRSPTCCAMPSITVSRRRKPASPPASRPRAGSPSAPATTPACWSWN